MNPLFFNARRRAFFFAGPYSHVRAPHCGTEPDDGGFRFRLKKLEDNGGDYNRAETVRAFLLSDEYRKRFGAQ